MPVSLDWHSGQWLSFLRRQLVVHAQQGEDLREAAQNPIADLISVPFQNTKFRSAYEIMLT